MLEVRDLATRFYTKRGVGRAVDGATFDLRGGEILGLVGESGCGKSVTCMSILRLNPAHVSRIVGGSVLFHGQDLVRASAAQMRRVRGRAIGLILQDPSGALDPCFTVGSQIYESLRLQHGQRGRDLREQAARLLARLRIPQPMARLGSYPHELSGGMQQRVVGAIAIAGHPEILIADEPTTALDVTTQAAYLATLRRMQAESRFSIIFVTHDLTIVGVLCARAAVMYAGRVVELGPVGELLASPRHPYTRALLRSRPSASHRVARLEAIKGQPPSIYGERKGCLFAERCDDALPECWATLPPRRQPSPDHFVECWIA